MGGTEAVTDEWNWTAVGLGVLVLAALACALVRLVHYRLSRHEFEVLLGGMVIRRVYLKDIEHVSLGSRFPAEYWPSSSLFGGGCLTIGRKRGLFRKVVVTPKDPEAMRVNLYYALGWKP